MIYVHTHTHTHTHTHKGFGRDTNNENTNFRLPETLSFQEIPVPWPLQEFGYYVPFPRDQAQALQQLLSLKSARFIDPAAKWFRLDFTTFNPNVGMFSYFEFTAEFSNTGFVSTFFSNTNIDAAPYQNVFRDNVRLVLEILVLVTVVANFGHEWYHYHKSHVDTGVDLITYFSDSYRCIALVHLFLMVVVIAMWAIMALDPMRTGAYDITPEGLFHTNNGNRIELGPVMRMQDMYFIINGVIIILSTVRALMYLRFNTQLSQLTETFSNMAGTLLQFLLVWLLNMVAFVLMAHLLFGDRLPQFASFIPGFNEAIGISMGGADYFSLMDANSWGAILFFFPFIFMQVFVFQNMVIAIILDGYTDMKREHQRKAKSWMKDVVNLDPLMQLFNGLLFFLRPFQSFMPEQLRARFDHMTKDGKKSEKFSTY